MQRGTIKAFSWLVRKTRPCPEISKQSETAHFPGSLAASRPAGVGTPVLRRVSEHAQCWQLTDEQRDPSVRFPSHLSSMWLKDEASHRPLRWPTDCRVHSLTLTVAAVPGKGTGGWEGSGQYLEGRLEGPHLQQLLLHPGLHAGVHHVPTSEEDVLDQEILNGLWVPRRERMHQPG